MELPNNQTNRLYWWVLFAMLVGGIIGFVKPELGESLKPLADVLSH